MAVSEITTLYKVRNIVNGDFYIGCTRQPLEKREWQHRNLADKGKGRLLHAAMREFGHDCFVFEVVIAIDDHDLGMALESEMVDGWKPAYNIAPGGRRRVWGDAVPKLAPNDGRHKPVKCLNDGRVFPSAIAAAAAYGLKARHVANTASGKLPTKSHHGFKFTYVAKQ